MTSFIIKINVIIEAGRENQPLCCVVRSTDMNYATEEEEYEKSDVGGSGGGGGGEED